MTNRKINYFKQQLNNLNQFFAAAKLFLVKAVCAFYTGKFLNTKPAFKARQMGKTVVKIHLLF